MTGWFKTFLAGLQDSIVSCVSEDIAEYEGFGTLVPTAGMPELVNMCENQIMKNVAQYQSFSLLGVAIIFVVGVFIKLLSWTLESLMSWCQNRFEVVAPAISSGCLRHPFNFGDWRCRRKAELGTGQNVMARVPNTECDVK